MNLRNILSKTHFITGLSALFRKRVLYNNFKIEFEKFRSLADTRENRFILHWKDRYPCLSDKTGTTYFDRHYVYHPAWAARIIAQTRPETHVDISSTLNFCAMISAFIPVRFYDYRPADVNLSDLSCERADLLDLPFASNSIQSLSCMHTVEHVGLGRYGDPLDPDGDLKAIEELKRVLAVGGTLLFVVPVGKPRIVFNAHRIYSYDQITSYFSDLELREFSLIPDNPADGGLIRNAQKHMADAQTYGCGCFWFTKK
jgi:SAM-dependent methyltransferase